MAGEERPSEPSEEAFEVSLFRWHGEGSWVFAPVPAEHAPTSAGPFGRVPVVATVDGRTWSTSVWRGKTGDWVLPVPARIRSGKDDGDTVTVAVELDPTRL